MDKVGIIPFKVKGGKLEILFITSQTRGRWVLPKGNMKKAESRIETCHREGFEEAGIKGVVLEEYPITVVVGRQIKKDELDYNPVTYYPFLVTSEHDDYPEKDERKRKWAPIEKVPNVAYRTDFGNLIEIIKDLRPWLVEAVAEQKAA